MGKKSVPSDQELYNKIKKKVKNRVKVWPSAYASGQLVSEYKQAFAEIYGDNKNPYLTPKPRSKRKISGELDRWFKEKWVNVCEKDKKGNYLPCGRSKARLDSKEYPYCRPMYRISKETPRTVEEFSEEELKKMCQYKRSKLQGISGKPTRIYHSNVLGGQKGGKNQVNNSDTLILRELSREERSQASKRYKKYAVDLPSGGTVYFGHNQYEDYTIHKDPARMENYLKRHKKREDWTLNGISTAGFWSRWLLWNKPSFIDSINNIKKRFNIQILNKTNRTD